MRRIGRFEISGIMMDDHCEEVSEVLAFMKFVPLRVERLGYKDVFDLIGVSRLFDEISEGTVVPRYQLTIETDEVDGACVVKNVVAEREW